jgi:peptide methionine sulfoxide reductase MsrA
MTDGSSIQAITLTAAPQRLQIVISILNTRLSRSAHVSYQQLLDVFWVNVDPFDPNGKFYDRGFSYLSAIFVANEEQRQLVDARRSKVIKQFSANKVVTPILDNAEF